LFFGDILLQGRLESRPYKRTFFDGAFAPLLIYGALAGLVLGLGANPPGPGPTGFFSQQEALAPLLHPRRKMIKMVAAGFSLRRSQFKTFLSKFQSL
jgi:hypothetical protein